LALIYGKGGGWWINTKHGWQQLDTTALDLARKDEHQTSTQHHQCCSMKGAKQGEIHSAGSS